MTSAKIRSAVLAEAVRSLSALDGVAALYLSGSLAERTEDQYSDIDLRVVIDDAAYDSVRALREQLPTTWGPFLFHQTVAENLTVTYYESLTKADVFYFPASSIEPSPWFNLGTAVLVDRHDAFPAILEASRALEFTGASTAIVTHLHQCIAALAESVKRARRGETIYATRLSAEAVHNLLISDDLMAGRAPLGSSKRESRVSGALTALLNQHLAVPGAAQLSRHVSALSAATLDLVDKAVDAEFCPRDAAAKLRTALAQLNHLSSGE